MLGCKVLVNSKMRTEMSIKTRTILLPLLFMLLASCGGSSEPSEYELAVQAAAAKEAEARALATDTPCAAHSQCTEISFLRTDTPCREYSWIAHSWASDAGYLPVAAANQQFMLAVEARRLVPPYDAPCTGTPSPVITAVCVANRCQVKQL
jgi:hypothetical protein